MLVRTKKVPQILQTPPMTVRVHAPVGVAVALWCGDPQQADGNHLVEWTVDQDILWGHNTQAAALAEPGLWEEADRVVMRGRLDLTEDGGTGRTPGRLFACCAPETGRHVTRWVS
ncbi:hypothetical protein OG264_00240 [Streptomyces xanthophaeus]|uniref:hypothetical protein n=1 Tax=Streptomyces xanthophaeus TaxID=67385 RepID=UPI00386E8786|nr:hypothetical protein OG264_00240 [Streptomyces xanthophaeus]WST64951.1 hypothetical protein OG605_38120 [Streptomyces xanthophaeus]